MNPVRSSNTNTDRPVVDHAQGLALELPPRPWLDIDPTGTKLSIWDSERTRLSTPRTLNLGTVFPDGTSLLDVFNIDWLRLVSTYIYLLRDEPDRSVHSAAVHHLTVQRLLTFLKWARLNGLFDLRRMTPKLAEKYSAEIALGTGYALRYADRLQEFIKAAGNSVPYKNDKHFPKRKRLDVEAICEATHISFHGLSADKAASHLLARVSEQHGFYRQGRRRKTTDPLPKPIPLTRATHSRHLDAVRLLHVWNRQLDGVGLSFVPCPTKADGFRSTRLQKTGHTKNLLPKEVMSLLDESLKWIFDFAPRILDLYDDVETEYKRLVERADSVDRWLSSAEIARLEVEFSRFLDKQDTKGLLPHGSHKVVNQGTNKGYEISRRILSGNLTSQSRRAAINWLGLRGTLSDEEIHHLVRRRLAKMSEWSSTWPYSSNQLASQIGVSIDTINKFVGGERFKELSVYERIENFLVKVGHIEGHEKKKTVADSDYRSDRGVKAGLRKFISEHPLNQPSDAGPWPLAWNVTSSSRSDSISVYQALRYCIPTAALVVLGVFQARRESELTSITSSCIETKADELWLETHIAKTFRCDTKLPTVDLSRIAVDLLTRWSKRGRAMQGSELLFSYWAPLGQSIETVKPNIDLNIFARLTLPERPSARLQIRQFRRFFAITFMWRYRMGSLPALSDFLCHSGIAMTWEYVTERVGTSVMLEAQSDFSREILVSAAIGKTKLQGPFGRVWHRWVEKVRAKISSSIAFTDELESAEDLLVEHIDDGIRLLVPTPGGFCSAGNRPRDIERAKCSTADPLNPDRRVKNPELSRPGQCARCPFAATDNLHEDYWNQAAQEARGAASLAQPSVLRERARQDVTALERVADAFGQAKRA